MNWNAIAQMIQERAMSAGLQILGALILYVVGRALIGVVSSAFKQRWRARR